MIIELKLLSDTCIGSGESFAGVIDIDVQFDEFGIPYIPAKRLKGILREAVEDYISIAELSVDVVDRIFGKKGDCETGSLMISNGYIVDYEKIKEIIIRGKNTEQIKDLFTVDNIKDKYTYIRTQTEIDKETGIAKKTSLRNVRVINKNERFIFNIEKLDNEDTEVLKNAMVFVNHIGVNRTRGLGFIEVNIKDNAVATIVSEKEKVNSKNNFMEYKITTKQPIIIEDDYISGGVVLGIFASKYIRNNKLSQLEVDKDKKFEDLFLQEKVVFSNAYPSKNNKRTYPTPVTFMKDKNDISNSFINVANDECEMEKDKRYIGIPYQYGLCNECDFEGYNVAKGINYHHRRADNKTIGRATKNSGQYFNYEAIEEGTEFIGIIKGSSELLEELKAIVNENNNIFIGASKSSQYGKAKIEFINHSELEDGVDNEEVNIVFASPMIIKNQYGTYSVDKMDLFEELNLKEEDVKAVYLKTREVGGFNVKWGLPKERTTAIKEGSVIVLNGKEKAKNIVNTNYGKRVSEGFGELRVVNIDNDEYKYSFSELKSTKHIRGLLVDEVISTKVLGSNSKNHIRKYIFSLYESILDKKITSLFNESSETSRIMEYLCGKEISNSVIANLVTYINTSNSFKDFDIQLMEASKRVGKDNVTKNAYKSICSNYLMLNDRTKDKFTRIIEIDFVKSSSKSNISKTFTSAYGIGYLNDENNFKIYKRYMNYLLKMAKYKRRKKEVI